METYVLLPETEYNRRCKSETTTLDSMIKDTLTKPHMGPEEKADAINETVNKFLRKKRSLEDSRDGQQVKRKRENSFEYPEPVTKKREPSYEYPEPPIRKRDPSYEYPEPPTTMREPSFEYPTPQKTRAMLKTTRKRRPKPYPKQKPLRQESIECSPDPQEGGWLSYW